MGERIPMPLEQLNTDRYGSDSLYDIVNDYDWTLAGAKARTNVPAMTLVQYEMSENALLKNLKYWSNAITSPATDPYKGLYTAKPTGITFRFPWFEDFHHNISQNWEDLKGLESTQLADQLLKVAQVATNSPGIAINTPKIWKGTQRVAIPYSITLFNTTTDSKASIGKNRAFINRLIASTLHDQQNAVFATPPALYTLDIPHVRYSPACVISNLNISNVGTMITDEGSKKVLPEAYKISFQLTELISESRQIFDGAIEGSKVKSGLRTSPTAPAPTSAPTSAPITPPISDADALADYDFASENGGSWGSFNDALTDSQIKRPRQVFK